jgi:hypothetical protein
VAFPAGVGRFTAPRLWRGLLKFECEQAHFVGDLGELMRAKAPVLAKAARACPPCKMGSLGFGRGRAQDAPANLEWLNRNREAYMGEWVALHKGRLIAHGRNGLDVFRAAQSQGIDPPLMPRIVPEDTASWGGWQAGAETQFSNRVPIQRRARNSPPSGVAMRRP